MILTHKRLEYNTFQTIERRFVMKRKWGKLLAASLSAAMIFSLTACGSGSGEQKKTSSGTASKASTASTASNTEQKSAETPQEIVNLKWVFLGGGVPSNFDAWKAEVNKYLAEKIGVNIDFEYGTWDNWGEKRNTSLNTGADYDIMFTDSGSYVKNVHDGAFLDITSLLDSDAPELKSFIPEKFWDAVKVDGQVYAVPTYKDSSRSEFFVVDKEMVDKYKMDGSKIHELKDLDPYVMEMAKNESQAPLIMNKDGLSGLVDLRYDSMGLVGLGVKYGGDKKLVSVFEQPEVMEDFKLLHKWYKNKVINTDAAVATETPKYKAIFVAWGWKGAGKTVWGPGIGKEVDTFQWGKTVLSNSTVGGSLNCISANSKNPGKALQFLQLLNLDTKLRDMFAYGLEGENFTYTDDKKVHKAEDETKKWPMPMYSQATFFTISQTDDVDFNQWDEVKELNENATPSPTLGINLDVTEFENELLNCGEIFNKYRSELYTGTSDPEKVIPQMMKEMRDAGFDEMMKKAQEQIDAAK